MSEQARGRTTMVVCLLLFGLFWTASVAYLVWRGGSPRRPIIALIVFGMAMPAMVLLFTRKSEPPPIPVEHPMRELVAVLAYLVGYDFYYLGWATGAVMAAPHPGPERDIAI